MEFLPKFLHKATGSRRKFLHVSGQRKRPKALISLGLSHFPGPWRALFWWSWRESNPRPKAIAGQIYTLS